MPGSTAYSYRSLAGPGTGWRCAITMPGAIGWPMPVPISYSMPLYLDPCALPCRIGQIYGALPIGFDGSAIHDCVEHLDMEANRGSGFLFENFDTNGFLWAMDQAMKFYAQPRERRAAQVSRIMTESLSRFDATESARQIMALYGRALGRPPCGMQYFT